MKTYISIFLILVLFTVLGCETVQKTAQEGGKVIGKGTKTVGGLTEGGLEGYMEEEASEENPYGR